MKISFRTKINAIFLPTLAALAIISIFAYRNTRLLVHNADMLTHSYQVVDTTQELLSELKDMETGQRGFILTGEDDYLAPYSAASTRIDQTLDHLASLTSDNPNQVTRISKIRKLVSQKSTELKETIQLRQQKGFNAALGVVMKNVGKTTMDDIRSVVTDMRGEEIRLLDDRNESVARSTRLAMSVVVGGGVFSIFVLLGAFFVVNLAENERMRATRKLESQNRLRGGLLSLTEKMSGEQSISDLAKRVLDTLAGFINAAVGSLYLVDDQKSLKRIATYAVRDEGGIQSEFGFGEGLVGEAAVQKKPMFVSEPPKDYLKISSSLGGSDPHSLALFPFLLDGKVKGVAEFATLSGFSELDHEFLGLAFNSVSVALNSAQARTQIAELLQETQAQSEELQTQQEELQTANEELQQKTQELEAQQEELKQTNEELEEQRTALEEQKNVLEEKNREVEAARRQVEDKAREVEAASKYKSEFLANMSHELRTPLNSILLLSQSLAENSDGNLTSEQEEYSRTIHSSGSDLLSLINDILDLSKVEAGKLNIEHATVSIAAVADAMKNSFGPGMKNKKLAFSVQVADDLPKTIVTDRLRLEQIIKNFISNSLKFTETGSVILSFERPRLNMKLSASGLERTSAIAISVADTGIGIPEEKRRKIFEAFEQGDGATSRKYGGAGLGLSIARKLAQLLGGEIQVKSSVNTGSTFTLVIPEQLTPAQHAEVDSQDFRQEPSVTIQQVDETRQGAHGIVDDRKDLEKTDKVILIIEDDPRFAKVLFGLCHQHGFKCLLAGDAESGLLDANEFLPSSIILDLRLPGMSGLAALGSLKGTPKTRHIPVHVMSVDDKGPEVMRNGAIGFIKKPASKSEIEAAFATIEKTLDHGSKKVLVIEDKDIERQRILKLIGNGPVKTIGVGSASEALKQLKNETFDCMILDLSLPDMSGFDLLKKIEKDESLSRCPVIVYTGRDLTPNELNQLRGFSQTIIVKGVHSEERLLDEVALFLHQVESTLPPDKKDMIEKVRHREEVFRGKKILIVDDDMRNVFALRSIFQKKGFDTLVAKTGKEAIESVKANPNVNAVLMDIMMPEMDGYEAIKIIRKDERFANLPIIALTAKAMSSDREKCLAVGASDYLPKPIDMDSLLNLLRVWLSR